jgi:hypothetical protein
MLLPDMDGCDVVRPAALAAHRYSAADALGRSSRASERQSARHGRG